MRQHEYEMICFRTAFSFLIVLAAKIAQKSFVFKICIWISDSGEQKDLKIRYLVAKKFAK